MPNTKSNGSEKKVQLVGGRYRPGTAIASIFQRLATGRPQTLAQLKSAAPKVKDLRYRVSRLRVHGKRSHAWTVTREGDKFQMVVRKHSTTAKGRTRRASAPKPAAPTATATAVN